MIASQVVGKRIVKIHQCRVPTRFTPRPDGEDEYFDYKWVIDGIELDNGKYISFLAIETDNEPAVLAIYPGRKPAGE